jgi:creatinine amidohydrolase
VRAGLEQGRDRVVVPFGALEQHESHLPLDTDTLLGDRLGPMLAERLDALCAPTIPIGCSEHHMGRAGTVSLRPETLALVVGDIVESLARHGFRTIVLLPTHAGNAVPLLHAARVLEPPSSVRVVVVADMEALARALHAAYNGLGSSVAEAIAHAGEIETSMMLAVAPAAVRAPSQRRDAAASRHATAGGAYVAAFLAECLRQLEAQGVA